MRRLFAGLGEEGGLEAEGIERFAGWWSGHLSNFGWGWAWADWAAFMNLGGKHPKRVLVERIIELEVRLSYFDRVKGTIPEVLLVTGVMKDEAPGPVFGYEVVG